MADQNWHNWGRYECLRPDQIDRIRDRRPIAFVPWGALEWHSYHAPIGLDGIKAHRICQALAARTGGIVLPPIYLGTETIKRFKGFKHTIEYREETIAFVCSETLAQLYDEGFKVLVVLTGHFSNGHRAVLEKCCSQFCTRYHHVRAIAVADVDPIRSEYQPDHAGIGETSYQLLFEPEGVDLNRVPQNGISLDRDGVYGCSPAAASATRGAEMLAKLLDRLTPTIEDLLEQIRRPKPIQP